MDLLIDRSIVHCTVQYAAVVQCRTRHDFRSAANVNVPNRQHMYCLASAHRKSFPYAYHIYIWSCELSRQSHMPLFIGRNGIPTRGAAALWTSPRKSSAPPSLSTTAVPRHSPVFHLGWGLCYIIYVGTFCGIAFLIDLLRARERELAALHLNRRVLLHISEKLSLLEGVCTKMLISHRSMPFWHVASATQHLGACSGARSFNPE